MITCTFESGKQGHLRHSVVDAVLLNHDHSQIFIIRRALHLVNGGKLALPGGYIDRDETCEEAILREVREETGYKAKVINLLRIIDNPDRHNDPRQNIAFIFICEAIEKIGEHDDEISESMWCKLDALPKAKEFAFDHFDIIQSYLEYTKHPRNLPIIG
jgi:mutator protein MutT